MNIFAIGRNYLDHITELNNATPEEPVIFTKPDTAIIRHNKPFYYPNFSKNIHYEVELTIRIIKTGKNIEKEFARNYYNALGIGIDFTARDLQQQAKEKGLPWDIAKGFNGSAPISDVFIPLKDLNQEKGINFKLEIDDEVRQKGNTQNMIFNFDYIIAYLSRFFTLKIGDIIFTGTPEGVGSVSIGNHLKAYIEDEKLLEVEVR